MSFLINPYTLGGGGGSPPIGPVTWDGITGATESPAGVLTKTASTAWGNCGAVSVETMVGDCRLTIYDEDQSKRFFIGIDPASSCNTFSGIDFAWFCDAGAFNCYQSGSSIDGVSPGASNIMMVIERIGTAYKTYYEFYTGARPLPNSGSRTHLSSCDMTGSGSTLYVNLAIFTNGVVGQVDASDLIWEAI